jgi:hypothetical protein
VLPDEQGKVIIVDESVEKIERRWEEVGDGLWEEKGKDTDEQMENAASQGEDRVS